MIRLLAAYGMRYGAQPNLSRNERPATRQVEVWYSHPD